MSRTSGSIRWGYPVLVLCTAVMLASCVAPVPAPQARSNEPAPATRAPAAPKRMVLGTLLVPTTIREGRSGGNMMPLAIGALTILDDQSMRRGMLAEDTPSIEKGTWKVLPDGRMETTWRLREGVKWHDGTPMTTDDLLFTATVGRDKEMVSFHHPVFEQIDGVEAPDARTVVVQWRQPSIEADQLFGLGRMIFTAPLPKHLLERPYLDNKAGFEDLSYWNTEYVGSGPFRLKQWMSGSGFVVEAFPDYVLGRPKLDTIEVKFFSDPNTLVANVLAGTVDLTTATSVSIDQGMAMRDQWRDGKMATHNDGWLMMYPQHHHPNPPAFGNPDFRRALILAVDRQALAETLTHGIAPVAQSIIAPDSPEYRFVESSIVKYDYDPRRAQQLIEGLGHSKGSDGMYRDAAGERPSVQIITPANGQGPNAATTIVDNWQRIGMGGEASIIPPQGLPCRPCYTGYDLVNQSHGVEGILNLLQSSSAPLPERNYRAPFSALNRGAYVNPEYDAIMDRYKATIPAPERMQLLAQLVHMQTDLQLVTGLFFNLNAVMVANRLQNVYPGESWNAHQWDVTS